MRGENNNTYLVNEEFETSDGVPAWIRLKVVNNAGGTKEMMMMMMMMMKRLSDGDDVNNDINFTSKTATITTTWSDFQDPESGLTPYSLSVFINQRLNKVFTDIEDETFTDHSFSLNHGDSVNAVLLATNSVDLHGVKLKNGAAYSLAVTAVNRARISTAEESMGVIVDTTPPEVLESAITASKPFLVLQANVAGLVLDGEGEDDLDFSYDMAAVAITFSGFSSVACGIVGYEWGVGTTPFATDVLPYSDFGLVVDDHGNGFAEAHIMQFEGQTYYSTVRAITGHNCHEEYIVSSSDGFTVDTTPPSVTFHVGTRQVTSDQVVYQTRGNKLELAWSAEDASGLQEDAMYFLRVTVRNGAGLETTATSLPLILDPMPPIPGLSFLERDGEVQALLWAQDVLQLKQMWITLDFDPGVTEAEYILRLHKTVGSDQETLEVTAIVNGEAKAAISGLVLQMEFVISVVTLPNVTVVTLAGKKVGLLENTERLELSLSLDAEDIDVEYYELAIGTAAGTDNVFPKTVVGSKNTTKVAIVHGFLKRDDVPSKDASIGDYTKKNYTSDTEPDPSANKFSMEPGRCLTQRLIRSKAYCMVYYLNIHILVTMPGPDIYLSPIAEAEFSEDVEVNYTVPSSVDIPDDSLVMILFWNPGREQLDANALAMGVVPQTVNFTITVQVSHVNDPPDIFYLPENYTDITQELLLGPTAGNGVNMSVLVEGNTTTLAVLGTVVFADKDLDDISFFDQKQETSGLKFIVEDLSPGDPQLSDILLVDTSKASGKRITLSLADGYPGRGLYEARVKDTADAFSLQLTLDHFRHATNGENRNHDTAIRDKF
nr:hypothetical protein BaRGS_032885 [Batillaria attramentaria]